MNERLIESMKRMQKNDRHLDKKIKLLLPDLDIAVSDHRFILLFYYAHPDLVLGYSMSIKFKKRNLRLQSRKLSVDDAMRFLSFSKN